jgi:hypothetical protein
MLSCSEVGVTLLGIQLQELEDGANENVTTNCTLGIVHVLDW